MTAPNKALIAPDRIWATPYDAHVDSGTYCNAESRPTAPNHDAWCYIRADISKARLTALLAENEALEQAHDTVAGALAEATKQNAALRAEVERKDAALRELREEAQALVDRWYTPLWGGSAGNLKHTGEYIAALQSALSPARKGEA